MLSLIHWIKSLVKPDEETRDNICPECERKIRQEFIRRRIKWNNPNKHLTCKETAKMVHKYYGHK